jgi:hypothetical protein
MMTMMTMMTMMVQGALPWAPIVVGSCGRWLDPEVQGRVSGAPSISHHYPTCVRQLPKACRQGGTRASYSQRIARPHHTAEHDVTASFPPPLRDWVQTHANPLTHQMLARCELHQAAAPSIEQHFHMPFLRRRTASVQAQAHTTCHLPWSRGRLQEGEGHTASGACPRPRPLSWSDVWEAQ